jgi:FkbM family methyltransferase
MGVTADDVVASIEMILGWTPSQDLVDYHLGLGFRDRKHLADYMMSTDEFRHKHRAHNQTIALGDRIMSYTHRGEVIYLAPTDLDLTPNVIRSGRHEPHVERMIVASINVGDAAIDIGCNVGYHTLAIAQAVGQSGSVFAYEANPSLSKLLHATLTVNNLTDFRCQGRVRLFKNAVADKPGSLILQVAPEHFGSGHLVTESKSSDFGQEYSDRVVVECVTLDETLAGLARADFLHMDIEGAEPLAIRGAQALLDRSPDIKIITEWSPHMMRTLCDPVEYVEGLVRRGFRFWRIGYDEIAPVSSSELFNIGHGDLYVSRIPPYERAPDSAKPIVDHWKAKAEQAAERRARLQSFGPRASAILVDTDHGFFAVDPEDSSVSSQLLHNGAYADNEIDQLLPLVSDTGSVLVVGSHVGSHVVRLSRRCHQLVAIEANPNTFRLLMANLALNRCDNVKAYNLAASDKPERLKFLLNRENSGGSKRAPVIAAESYFYDNPEEVEIEAVALDDLLGEREFDLILMDIEGSEYFALRGMQRLLTSARALAVEFLGHHITDVAGVTIEQFSDVITPFFEFLYVPGAGVTHRPHVGEKLAEMFYAGQGHDLIYFFKTLPEALGQ